VTGATGSTGVTGATGATGNSATSASAYTATSSANAGSFFVLCPGTQVALGGGGYDSGGSNTIIKSQPTDATGAALAANGVGRGWLVTLSATNHKPTVWVICAP
jgi:hypothetical protein